MIVENDSTIEILKKELRNIPMFPIIKNGKMNKISVRQLYTRRAYKNIIKKYASSNQEPIMEYARKYIKVYVNLKMREYERTGRITNE